MLKIRLARVGKRGHATFRIVVTEHTRPPKSGSFAQLGSYDPHTNVVRVNAETLKRHLAHGAKMSATVQNLLIENKVIEGKKVVAWKPRRKQETNGQAAETPAPSAEAAGKAPPNQKNEAPAAP